VPAAALGFDDDDDAWWSRVELTVLGAGPAYSNRPGATGAAYLVRAESSTILLDLGQGSFPRLTTEVEPSDLAAVFISHLHPDHFIDLVPLRHYLRYHFTPGRRARVFGSKGLAERLDCLHGQPGFAAEALDISDLSEGLLPVDALTVEARRVTHTAESYGFRVAPASGDGEADPGPTPGLVYSGDCGEAADLAPLIRIGDTLLTEVYFGPSPVAKGAFHLNSAAVGELAASTGVGRVLLTHLQMGHDERRTIAAVRDYFDGPVELVEPGSHLAV
jgi:ribonuclease BN (tRNA processing enzyme)